MEGAIPEASSSRSVTQSAGPKSPGTRESKRFLPHIFASHNSQLVDLIEEHKVSRSRAFAINVLLAPAFDYCMGFIILANMVIMIIELDQKASTEGQGQSKGKGKDLWTEVFGWVALFIFVMELLFRIFAYRWMFFRDSWNIFDLIIVFTDAIFSVIGVMVGQFFPMSVLRTFRLAKLARVSKLLRVFPSLRVLLAGLMGSFSAIFWGVLLLAFVLLVWAMVAVSFVHPLAMEVEFPGCSRCPQAYNSVMRASLTLWQQVVAGDSWGQISIPVIEKYPATILFFLPMFLCVSLAVMNLIFGVVVQVALTAKEQIEDEDYTYRKLFKMENQTHLLNLCHQMDVKHSGELSRDTVFEKFDEPGEFRDSILAMDVTEEDFNIIWAVVDADKKGMVQYQELVQRLYSVRSSDTDFMLAYIKYYITLIRHDLLETLHNQHEESMIMQKMLDEAMHEVQDKEEQILETGTQHAELFRGSSQSWQILDEARQKMYKLQESKESEKSPNTNPKGPTSVRGSFVPVDSSPRGIKYPAKRQGLNSCMVASDTADGATLVRGNEIEALRMDLNKLLIDMNQKLESEVVSFLTQAMLKAPTDSKRAIQAKSMVDVVVKDGATLTTI